MSPTDFEPIAAIPPMFAGLCDDAALFPPGNAAAADALPAHTRYRGAWFAPLVGPFLVGANHLAVVADALEHASASPDAVLVVRGGPPELAPSLDAARRCGLRLVGVELGSAPTGSPAEAARAAATALARLPLGDMGGVVEVRRSSDAEMQAALDALAGTGCRAKLRTGGTVADAFPSAAEVATFIGGCVARGLPFKCTAGLHQAVRHTDPVTGFEHHGFLNILAATASVLSGAGPTEVTAVLEQRDGAELAANTSRMTPRQASLARASFTAYGTCSITEPLEELARLGLVSLPTDPLDRA
ncbi:hypothetical protein [Streptantibioticus ferralitis]|uniref:Uncharacterized protein n=1 Tax=Streptantibioticus ferralitis TaxID=236510 RepID=A0ABT5YZF9_9ACTN|nr:hypothetical protein [Streptantibioticus ferralitis]MDF2256839.1 hypothetical protein [Streptantibioticus ferralitis]